MYVCTDLALLSIIRSSDFITYLALLLAYLAYVRSINNDFDSWKSLLISFESDLNSQRAWLGGDGYCQETYRDKSSFSPLKVIFPLSFESLPEIIRRGLKGMPNVSDKFIYNLSLFNERIVAFNSALDHIKKISCSNPILSEKLAIELEKIGIKKSDEDLDFDSFKNLIRDLKDKNDIFHLAENIRRQHRLVHVELIGNGENKDKLNYLYHEISKDLEIILKSIDYTKPLYLRNVKIITLLSLISFFIIEILLK